jgi:hypothetical protein
VRFITTHGFWRSIALKAAWVLAFNEATLFGGLPVFKFGNDSVTPATIRVLISQPSHNGSATIAAGSYPSDPAAPSEMLK